MNAIAQAWLAENSNKFTSEQLVVIRAKLEEMGDTKIAALSSLKLMDSNLMFVLALFFGEFGIHRMLLGDIVLGVIEFLTFGACGILWFIDLFLIIGRTKEYNYKKILPLLC